MTRRPVLILVAAATVVAIGAIAARRLVSPTADAPPTSVLVVDDRDLDFGEVWETDRFVKTVRVRNTGPVPVRVTPLNPACGCAKADAPPVAIGPGETAEVRFDLDLRGECVLCEPGAARPVTLPVSVQLDPPVPVPGARWNVRGRVRPVFSVPVRTVDLGRIPAARGPEPRTIAIRSWIALSQLDSTTEGIGFTAALAPAGDPQRWNLVVTRSAGLPAASYTGTIQLAARGAAGEVLPTMRLPVEFDLLADVQPDTPILSLGSCRVGTATDGTVTLSSLSGRAFTVTRWVAEPANTFEVVSTEPMGTTRSFAIRHRVQAVGDCRGTVRFVGTDADGTPFETVIEVRSYGTPDN
ncbi:MAG: DUF1573 domain-containing protein [Gemmataceae bacterium]|nr:DUF1573 domain-containing protein [Gemmataceae bacterium]